MDQGADIRALGLLFIVSGTIDAGWILAYPDSALKVFGAQSGGWAGWLVKLQHPLIHWLIGWGFFRRRCWAYLTYLLYLALACASEITTQLVGGYHPVRTVMIVLSLLFAAYVVSRREAFS